MTPIAIHDIATAQTSIFVSGFQTEIADVTVTLNNVSIGLASDLDLLLVGPGGQTAIIMSDVAATTVAVNENLILSDQGPSQLSISDNLTSGVFRPTNYDFGSQPDRFAPNPLIPSPLPSGSALAVFNGTDPNGVPSTEPDSFQAQVGQTLTVPAVGVLENDSDPDGNFLTAVLAGQPK